MYTATYINCVQVVIMLLVLLFVFTVCWLPLLVSILYSEHRHEISLNVSYFVFSRTLQLDCKLQISAIVINVVCLSSVRVCGTNIL